MSPSRALVFDDLQKEFCPPLDSSLVAALLADVDFSCSSESRSSASAAPGSDDPALKASLDALRDLLKQLADQAELDSFSSPSFFKDNDNDKDEAATSTSFFTSDADVDDARRTIQSKNKSKSQSQTSRSNSNSSSSSATTTTTANTTPSSEYGCRSSSDSCPSYSSSAEHEPFPFDSPLGFLQAALPHVPIGRLKKALQDAGKDAQIRREMLDKESTSGDGSYDIGDEEDQNDDDGANANDGDLDMWEVIASILTAESIREMEERGIAGLDDEDEDERLARALAEEDEADDQRARQRGKEDDGWVTVQQQQAKGPKKKKQRQQQKQKQKASQQQQKGKAVTIVLGDVRQTASSSSSISQSQSRKSTLSTPTPVLPPLPDRWTQVVSLSSLLATLLPSQPASFFQSYFHSPKYPNSYEALCGALRQVCAKIEVEVRERQEREREERQRRQQQQQEQQKKQQQQRQQKQRQNGRNQRAGLAVVPQDAFPPPPGKSKNRVRGATERHHHPPMKPPTKAAAGAGSPEQPRGRGEEGGWQENGGEEDGGEEEDAADVVLLYNLLDILLPQYGLDPATSALSDDDNDNDIDNDGARRRRALLVSEIELAVRATEGRGDDALDLVKLMRELDEEREMRFAEQMVEFYYSGRGDGGGPVVGVATGTTGSGSETREGVSYADSVGSVKPTAPPAQDSGLAAASSPWAAAGAAGTVTGTATGAPLGQKAKQRPSPYQWQAVAPRRAPKKQPYQILPHLPTYTRDVNGIRRRGPAEEQARAWVRGMDVLLGGHGVFSTGAGAAGAGTTAANSTSPSSGNGRYSHSDEAEAAEREYRRQIGENMRRREELLREAAKMWNQGRAGAGAGRGRGGRGGGRDRTVQGDVAWYFAERAREFQELARQESLNAARAMVYRKRSASGQQDVIDMHGTTVAEALVIIKEVLAAQTSSKARPLKIITGRGAHSVNHTSVLKRAVKKRLVEEGWNVGTWDAGLVVRGKM